MSFVSNFFDPGREARKEAKRQRALEAQRQEKIRKKDARATRRKSQIQSQTNRIAAGHAGAFAITRAQSLSGGSQPGTPGSAASNSLGAA